jgi:Cys-tRNA(Pro)/Cys-tRNA(Cys) deacylase
MIYRTVVELLENSGAIYRMHRHEPVTTIEQARQKVPHLTHNLLKTIVFRIKDTAWILAAVNGDARIHYKKLADAVAVKRRALRSISPDQVESELGFEIGGVGPFPVRPDIQVVFDRSVGGTGNVFCGSGRNTRTVEMDIADLIDLTGGSVHPLCK